MYHSLPSEGINLLKPLNIPSVNLNINQDYRIYMEFRCCNASSQDRPPSGTPMSNPEVNLGRFMRNIFGDK